MKPSCELLVSICFEFCCFLPKRACLVIFAVLKILADLAGNVVLGYAGLAYLLFNEQSTLSDNAIIVLLSLAVILDISFMIILIVGVCKRSNSLYKVSYYYSITSLVLALTITVIGIIIAYSMQENVFKDIFGDDLTNTQNFFIYASLIGIYTFIHGYMIAFMKSEMNKTENLRRDPENIIKLGRSSEVAYGRFH